MITLKYNEVEENENLIKFLKDGEGEFSLPSYLPIPKGERAMSQRARILMLAGLEALKEKHPQKKDCEAKQIEKQTPLKNEIAASWT